MTKFDLSAIKMVRTEMFQPGADAAWVRKLLFSAPVPQAESIDHFSGKDDLLKALHELKLASGTTTKIYPIKWIHDMDVPGEEEVVSIATDLPPNRENRESASPRVFQYPDEASVIIEHLKEHFYSLPKNPRILDLCTGAGTIAILLAKMREDATVIAVDKLPEAVEQAELNVLLNGLDANRVRVYVGDLWDSIKEEEPFDMIVADPPFSLRPDKVPRPTQADDGGPHGDMVSGEILRTAHQYLSPESHSRLFLLAYSLGKETKPDFGNEESQEHLHIHEAVRDSQLDGSFRCLEEQKIWRYEFRKAFANPMKVEYMILRLGDKTRPEAILDSHADEQIDRINMYTEWIGRRRAEGFTHLHYVIGQFRRQPL